MIIVDLITSEGAPEKATWTLPCCRYLHVPLQSTPEKDACAINAPHGPRACVVAFLTNLPPLSSRTSMSNLIDGLMLACQSVDELSSPFPPSSLPVLFSSLPTHVSPSTGKADHQVQGLGNLNKTRHLTTYSERRSALDTYLLPTSSYLLLPYLTYTLGTYLPTFHSGKVRATKQPSFHLV